MTVTTTTEHIATIAWGCSASEITPDCGDIEPDGCGWFRYAGTPFRLRRMTGSEKVEVTIKGGRAVAFHAESWILDRLGQPGRCLFSARAARALAESLC